VAIAGGGVAGIALARRLSAAGLRVALIEAGERHYSPDSQAFYQGVVTGQDYFDLDITRLRQLGGSSGHWGGWCRPLDAIDFEAKPWAPTTGWPIAKTDLDPYLAAAADILDVPGRFEPESRRLALGDDAFEPIGFDFSAPPTRLADKYEAALAADEALDVYLNLAVVDLPLDESGTRLVRFDCRRGDPSTPEILSLTAERFVLALGGLETPRLLLNSNRQRPAGIGNDRDLVGRYFADHPHFTFGHVLLERDIPETFEFMVSSRRLMEARQILSVGLRIYIYPRDETATRSGMKERLRRILCSTGPTYWLARQFNGSFSCLNATAYNDAFDGVVRAAYEQVPNPQSRVYLTDRRDPFGQRRIALDWRLTAAERRAAMEAAVVFGQRFADAGLGRLRLADWLADDDAGFPELGEDEVGGNHHMGTTRMAVGPETGVVDRDCRVFGTDNLYIAGSSVFPAYGHANPTFTITQLALRLADHLAATAS
jgi:choline dehydrogenase-like flavoprotein